VKIHSIAQTQGISHRFLEAILNELKRGGFVDSRRGNGGGYILSRDARQLTIGEVFEYMQGAISVVPDSHRKSKKSTVRRGDNAFEQLWQEVNQAMLEVWNRKTFADLVEFERNSKALRVPNYVI
jgi:Rrf2 family protein